MKTYLESCDDNRLRMLLNADEDSNEFAAAASHVDSCPHCQTRLTELVAETDEWAEARELLNLGEADAGFASESRDCIWSSAAGLSTTTNSPTLPTWTEAMIRQVLAPPSHPEMLGRLGRYEIERLIGSGGMGVVFKGFDTELNRPVAIKVLAPHLSGHGAARQRFAREARAAAAVVHEHVVSIHNVESDGTAPFLVMKFIAGESLQTRIDRQGPLDLCEILRIAHQTAAGLAAAHAQGLVHRDVKPSNILLEQGLERALLTDFGLARASDDASLTHTGYMPGTPHYMSPEQARGESVDARSDLFSLGSVMYAMGTGRPPFRADTSFGILRRITDNQPRPIREVNPAIPDWLAAIIAKLHAKSPGDRFESAGEVATLLAACLAHVQQPTVVSLPVECRVETSPRRYARALTIAATVMICLGIGAISLRPWQWNQVTLPSSEVNIDPATEWDVVDQELSGVLRDTNELEPRVRSLWDE
jgi:serine/threonine protein kinase